jgi:hypothetical protein
MDWQARYYPLDLFPSLNSRIEGLISAGTFQAAPLVREEIGAVGTPDLKTWVANHPDVFVPLMQELQLEAAAIEARYPDLMDPKGLHVSADAYVIALARLKGGIVVSQETSAHEKRNPTRNHYIPDVCRDLGVSCINLLGLMHREKWRF